MKRILVLALAVAFLLGGATEAQGRRLELPGAWYSEAQPDGSYSGSVGTAIQTDRGAFAVSPGGDLLYLRLSPDGRSVAGQGHDDGQAWELSAGQWTVKDPIAIGVSPVIYRADGSLVVSHGGAVGSQGYRYVEDGTGRLVTGDETYASGALGLYEFTIHGDIAIGQGANGGCIAVRGLERRVIEPGDCRFVRYNRAGDAIAVAIVNLAEHKAILRWFSAGELSAFPAEAGPVVPPPPPPVDPPPPPQLGKVPDDIFEKLVSVRSKYPTPLGDQGGALINEVAWQFRDRGVGLELKAGGNNCPQPKTGKRVACDILRIFNVGYDVLHDQETSGDVQQAEGGPASSGSFLGPVDPGVIVPPPPPPPPPPDQVPVLKARIAELEAQLSAAGAENARVSAALGAAIAERDALRVELDALKNRPAPSCVAKVPAWVKSLGIKVGCEVVQ